MEIALTTFDLLAQNLHIGTLWDGFAKWTIDDLVPELKTFLGIPEDHIFGGALLFGKPSVKYYRTVQKTPANINRVGETRD